MATSNSYVNKRIAAILEQRWGNILNAGKGISSPAVRYNTAVLLENQRQYMERNGLLNEVGTTADVTGLPTTIFPIIRRVYPNIIANDIVGVQPMTSPSGVVFYMQYYSPTGKTLYGADKTSDAAENGELLTWNSPGRFALDESYASTMTRNELITPGTGDSISGAGSVLTIDLSVSPKKVAGNAKLETLKASLINDLNKIVLRVFYKSQFFGEQVLYLNDLISDGEYYTATNHGGTKTYTTGLGFIAALSLSNAAFDFTGVTVSTSDVEIYADYTYQVGVTGATGHQYNAEGDATFGANDSGNFPIPEMELRIYQGSVNATKKALKTAWTIENEQDMKAFHNLDVEKELVTVMSSELAAEIDREIITDLRNNVGFTMVHDWQTANISGVGTATGGSGLGLHYQDLATALATTILAGANQIYRRTFRGAGNWTIMSPVLSARLEALNIFKYNGGADADKGGLGIESVGTLNGQIKVIKDPLTYNNQILMGYKGGSFMDVGYVYCPYVPVTQIETLTDPGDLTRKKAVVTRYGKLLVKRGYNFYASISVTNTPEAFTNYYAPVATQLNGATIGGLPGYTSGKNQLTGTHSLV
jgi:hypothetical protein